MSVLYRITCIFVLFISISIVSLPLNGVTPMHLSSAAFVMSHDVANHLRFLMLIIFCAVTTVVYGVMLLALARLRQARLLSDILWTTIPFAMLTCLFLLVLHIL